jgi:hypothetical protein
MKRPFLYTPFRRIGFLTLLVCGLLALAYTLWEPGDYPRDGRHDRGQNGLWLAHGWLGDDAWFHTYHKESQFPAYRSPESLTVLARLCTENHITDLFPHLCPCEVDGTLPAVDPAQTERFLDVFAEKFRVIPWIGGPGPIPARYDNAKWRDAFCASVRALFAAHPRLHGIQLNIEPLPSGDASYLTLLDELHAALPPGKILSVAAYPPPTRWQPSPSVHWDETYFRAVAQRADQIAVMLYDTALTRPKLYRKLMSDWTVEVLQWSGNKPVLLGLPAYEDSEVDYHDPKTESLKHALSGLHAGLRRAGDPANYQGAALYSHWEMNDEKWKTWRERFLKISP